jgi:ATP/maltotriose-dependent transcriptional regulator MalT
LSPTTCQALIASGQLDKAEQRLETTLEATRTSDMPHWEAMALKARGQLRAARGGDEASRNDLELAIEIFERLESRLESRCGPRRHLSSLGRDSGGFFHQPKQHADSGTERRE